MSEEELAESTEEPVELEESAPPEEEPEAQPADGEVIQPPDEQKGINKRFRKLTTRAKTAEDRAEQAERELTQLRSQQSVVGEPKYDDFDTDEEYQRAIRVFDRNLVKQEIKQESAASSMQTESARVISEYEQRIVEADIEGYHEAEAALISSFAENDPALGDLLNVLLVDKETGPQLMVHLGNNTAKAQEIAKMPLTQRTFALGKLSAKLSAKPVKKTTKAPPPIKPAGSGGANTTTQDQSKWSMEQIREYKENLHASKR